MKVRVVLPVALVVGVALLLGTNARAFEFFGFGGSDETCKGDVGCEVQKDCESKSEESFCWRPCLVQKCAVGIQCAAVKVKCQVENLQCRFKHLECGVLTACDAIKDRLCHPFCNCSRCCEPCCKSVCDEEKGCDVESGCAVPQK